MTLLPIAVFWVFAVMGMLRTRPWTHTWLLFATIPLGTFAVIPTQLSAGMTLTGPPVVASLMLLKSLFRRANLKYYLDAAFRVDRLGLLFAFCVVALAVTAFAPRVFRNQVTIVPMKAEVEGLMITDKLHPVKQNISQLLYISISASSVFVFSRIYRSAEGRQQAMQALRFGAGLTVVTGVLDLASQFLPLSPLLDLFRTASYALLVEVVMDGAKRVVGLMAEASSYGTVCLFFLSVLYFARFVDPPTSKVGEIYSRGLLLLLAMMLILSLSSAAYVGLVVLGAMAVVEWLVRGLLLPESSIFKRGLKLELTVFFLLCVVGTGALVGSSSIREQAFSRFESLLLDKSESLSFEERNMWTTVSLESLWATTGIGVGLGGTRSSNRTVSIFSNTGILGGCLFYAFVLQTLFRNPGESPTDIAIMHAVRWSFLPMFAVEWLIGTTPDFGITNAWIYGMASGIAFSRDTSAVDDETLDDREDTST